MASRKSARWRPHCRCCDSPSRDGGGGGAKVISIEELREASRLGGELNGVARRPRRPPALLQSGQASGPSGLGGRWAVCQICGPGEAEERLRQSPASSKRARIEARGKSKRPGLPMGMILMSGGEGKAGSTAVPPGYRITKPGLRWKGGRKGAGARPPPLNFQVPRS